MTVTTNNVAVYGQMTKGSFTPDAAKQRNAFRGNTLSGFNAFDCVALRRAVVRRPM